MNELSGFVVLKSKLSVYSCRSSIDGVTSVSAAVAGPDIERGRSSAPMHTTDPLRHKEHIPSF